MPRTHRAAPTEGHSLSLPDLPLDLLGVISSHLGRADKQSLRHTYREAWSAPFLQPTRVTLDFARMPVFTTELQRLYSYLNPIPVNVFDDHHERLIVRCLADLPQHHSIDTLHFKSHRSSDYADTREFARNHRGVLEGFTRALKRAIEDEQTKEVLQKVNHIQLTDFIGASEEYYCGNLRLDALTLLHSSFPSMVKLSLDEANMSVWPSAGEGQHLFSQLQTIHNAGLWPSVAALSQFQNVKEVSAMFLPSLVAPNLHLYFPNLQHLRVSKVLLDVLPDFLRGASLIPRLTSVSIDTLGAFNPTLSQECCDTVSRLLPQVPFHFAGTLSFAVCVDAVSLSGQAANMFRDTPLGRNVKSLIFWWRPWQSIVEAVPEILQACPHVKSVACQHLSMEASPCFHGMDCMSISVHRPFRKDPAPSIRACEKMLKELSAAGWPGVVEGVRVYVTASAEFSSKIVKGSFQL